MNARGFYIIGRGAAPGTRDAMGAKAYHLAQMEALDLPVPPAFAIGTAFCAPSLAASGLAREVDAALPSLLASLEAATGLGFGDARRPLLVSVRSGAPVSMPGMMQTLLNIGLTERTLYGFVRTRGNPRLAFDAYRRLIAQYGEVVAGIPAQAFEEAQAAIAGDSDERSLDFAQHRAIAARFLDIYRDLVGVPFPQEAREQLERAIEAVFRSWRAPHALAYRAAHGIAEEPGTGVVVQAMVFGNSGGRSGAGVGFTRNPTTGEREPWIDYLANAQGEDVVSGRRAAHGAVRLEHALPFVWNELVEAAHRLESALADMQDIEFTVEDGRLYILQTRAGKRSSIAALRILLDLYDEGIIDAATACDRARALDVDAIVVTRIAADSGSAAHALATGVGAAGGVACGEIAFDEARTRARAAAGASVVLVRRDAETSDLTALDVAAALVTARGARTSHAAVVARSLGKVCIVGCTDLAIDATAHTARFGERTLNEGETITIDGNTGRVYMGAIHTVVERPRALLERLSALPGYCERPVEA